MIKIFKMIAGTNIANKITLFRVLSVPVIMVLLYQDTYATDIISLVLFIISSISDFLDGYIARKYNLITDFGKIVDPVADKIAITSVMLILIQLGRLDAWIVAVIVSRDLLIEGLRSMASSKGMIIAAGQWGKIKTVFHMIAVSLLICNTDVFSINMIILGNILIYVSMVLSIYSAYIYIKEYLKESKTSIQDI